MKYRQIRERSAGLTDRYEETLTHSCANELVHFFLTLDSRTGMSDADNPQKISDFGD